MPTTLPHTPRPQQTTRPRSRLHPLFFLGLGMLATLALIAVLSIVTSCQDFAQKDPPLTLA
jgi:hypothetical protein